MCGVACILFLILATILLVTDAATPWVLPSGCTEYKSDMGGTCKPQKVRVEHTTQPSVGRVSPDSAAVLTGPMEIHRQPASAPVARRPSSRTMSSPPRHTASPLILTLHLVATLRVTAKRPFVTSRPPPRPSRLSRSRRPPRRTPQNRTRCTRFRPPSRPSREHMLRTRSRRWRCSPWCDTCAKS